MSSADTSSGNASVETQRLFIAIEIPDEVKAGLVEAQKELQAVLPRHAVRWTRPDQMHLTLRFLGNVRVLSIELLTKALVNVVTGVGAVSLQACGIGCFPNLNRPRVIWAGLLDRAGRLESLQKEVENAVQPFTREPPEARFKGHLTLGRIKEIERGDIASLRAIAEASSSRSFGNWTTQTVALLRSQLTAAGSHHFLVSTANLERPL